MTGRTVVSCFLLCLSRAQAQDAPAGLRALKARGLQRRLQPECRSAASNTDGLSGGAERREPQMARCWGPRKFV